MPASTFSRALIFLSCCVLFEFTSAEDAEWKGRGNLGTRRSRLMRGNSPFVRFFSSFFPWFCPIFYLSPFHRLVPSFAVFSSFPASFLHPRPHRSCEELRHRSFFLTRKLFARVHLLNSRHTFPRPIFDSLLPPTSFSLRVAETF